MLLNPCTSIDFILDLKLDGHELNVVEELREAFQTKKRGNFGLGPKWK